MGNTAYQKKGDLYKTLGLIFSLALPTMLEQLMHTAVQYIDTAMVGSLGTASTAAVGATTTVNWLVGSTLSAIGVGFLAYISRACGAGETEKARRASAQAVLAVIFCGLLFTAVTLSLSGVIPVWMQVEEGLRPLASRYFFILYTPMLARCASIVFGTVLRAAGDTKTPMLVGIIVNVINVVMNFLLIYPTRYISVFGIRILMPGADLGITGAALASALAFWVGGICISAALWTHPKVTPRGCSFKPDASVLKPCLRVALPNAFQRFGTSMGYVVFASMVNSLGEIATAAHTVANTVESAFYVPGYGMQSAAATLAGNCYGSGDKRKLKDISRTILAIEVILMIISGTLLYLFAPQMMGIFSKDKEVIELGATVLRMVALSEPFYGVSIIIEGMMQGMGKTVMSLVCNVIGMWCVRIAGTFVCTQLMSYGLVSAWACMILHNMLLFVMFGAYFISGRWNPLKDK